VTIELSRGSDSDERTVVDPWFKQFISLGVRLAKISSSQSSQLSRILLAVPRIEFVAIAISIGLSLQKSIAKESLLREISKRDLETLEADSSIRLLLRRGPRDVTLKSYSPENDVASVAMNGMYGRYKVDNVIKFYKLPSGHPEGEHFIPLEDFDETKIQEKQENWRTQTSPSAIVFGDASKLEAELASAISYAVLEQASGGPISNLGAASRLDNFSRHTASSFINCYGDVSEFPDTNPLLKERLSLFDWTILNGNYATAQLSTKEVLLADRVLAIIETGVPRMQDRAIDAFLSETQHFNRIDVARHLTWQPFHGVQMWGWSK
jgi:hypothetical protein